MSREKDATLMEKAYRYRFYPTLQQETLLWQTVGCVRLVYNRALAMRTDDFYKEQKRIEYGGTSTALTQWRKQEDLYFLKDGSSVPLQQSLRHLQSTLQCHCCGHIVDLLPLLYKKNS